MHLHIQDAKYPNSMVETLKAQRIIYIPIQASSTESQSAGSLKEFNCTVVHIGCHQNEYEQERCDVMRRSFVYLF